MKKTILFFLVFFLICMADFFLSKTSIPVNQLNYMMGYNNFYKNAKRTKGQKRIILLGGSSLGWGISAAQITDNLGVLTLNAGIHAGVGYRGAFVNVQEVLDKKNDIIVISPEYSFPNYHFRWGRSGEFCEINTLVIGNYPLYCLGYSMNKIARITPMTDRKQGDYFSSGFNEFGDYVYRRDAVNMTNKVIKDPTCLGINLEELVNHYIPFYKNLKNNGYNIVYIPNFVPRKSCADVPIQEKFHEKLFDEFGVDGFRTTSHFFEEKYFYDSNYHLTQEGVQLKTSLFTRQLNQLLKAE